MFATFPEGYSAFAANELIRQRILHSMWEEGMFLWAHVPTGRPFVIAVAQKMVAELLELDAALAALHQGRGTITEVISEMADVQELCALIKQQLHLRSQTATAAVLPHSARTCWNILATRECCQQQLTTLKKQQEFAAQAVALTEMSLANTQTHLQRQKHTSCNANHVLHEQLKKAQLYGAHEGVFLSNVVVPNSSLWLSYYRAKWPVIDATRLDPATATTPRQLGFS